jgi:hypothetical protein
MSANLAIRMIKPLSDLVGDQMPGTILCGGTKSASCQQNQ